MTTAIDRPELHKTRLIISTDLTCRTCSRGEMWLCKWTHSIWVRTNWSALHKGRVGLYGRSTLSQVPYEIMSARTLLFGQFRCRVRIRGESQIDEIAIAWWCGWLRSEACAFLPLQPVSSSWHWYYLFYSLWSISRIVQSESRQMKSSQMSKCLNTKNSRPMLICCMYVSMHACIIFVCVREFICVIKS